ncbi:MAG: sulfatase-like hydrolase/transferase [Planctomycetia bacterium]|nr:sulfatase-like hydrolase/transferase [Planctomycetia bacterium]
MKRIVSRAALGASHNILCITVDRLNVDFLGAYGNTWLETPAFDQLASEAVLCDSYFIDTVDLEALYSGLWRGTLASQLRLDVIEQQQRASLFRAMKEKGRRVYLVSDDENVALSSWVESEFCDDRLLLQRSVCEEPVDTIEQTQFYRNFEELAKLILKLEDHSRLEDAPWFIWAHFSSLNEIWDFPLSRRQQFQETAEDPEPFAGTKPPFFPLQACEERGKKQTRLEAQGASEQTEDDDAETARLRALDPDDRRQCVVETYAAGVSVFDETLGGFLALLKEQGVLERTLFVLCGARGFATGRPSALGLSQRYDSDVAPFYAEQVNAPLVIRLPERICATTRLATLCQPCDLFETLRAYTEFRAQLYSEDFWKLERLDVSPFAGDWSGEQSAYAKRRNLLQDDTPDPEAPLPPGQNILALLNKETASLRDRVAIVARDARSQERALFTQSWALKERVTTVLEEETPRKIVARELFYRPDDRYNVVDVASRGQDEVEELTLALQRATLDTPALDRQNQV